MAQQPLLMVSYSSHAKKKKQIIFYSLYEGDTVLTHTKLQLYNAGKII